MKLSKLALVAAIACGTYAGNVFADQTNDIQLVSHCAAKGCDCGEPVCCCEEPATCDSKCCDSGCDSCGCGSGCGLSLGGLTGMLDGCGMCGDCCLGDPWQLFGEHCGYSMGGWLQLGYHSAALPAFNTFPDNLQLQQAWLYAEKAIDTECGFDIGGRIDYVYGTDGPNTQAFGTDPRGWDNSWDNGGQYGHAIPQLYVEAGYGDLSVIAGHFYTIIGYEVVPATGNFFYSHVYTFNFSEPFTHTGILAKYNVSDDVTVRGGYSLGIDSGFDNNGDSFLGGISVQLSDDLSIAYNTNAGRLLEPWSGVVPLPVTGYQHSIVADYAVTDSLQYIIQNDVLASNFSDGTNFRDTVGINQYLIKTINDCWSAGVRFEWYNITEQAQDNGNIYDLTLGVNYRPHANVVFRPEVRWDWNPDQVEIPTGNFLLEGNDKNQTTFGVDAIFTF